MNWRVVSAALAVIFLVSFVSGTPSGEMLLVNANEADENPHEIGSGNATVRVDELPNYARFERGQYGSGAFYLRIPSADVTVVSAEKKPMLVYKIQIAEMSFVRSSVRYIGAASVGPMRLRIQEATFGRDRIQKSTYQGELKVFVRASNREFVIANRSISIEVDQ